ncbi:MAG: hypothetical protein LBN29_12775 [Mediterranea sp.]|nr:hypothetical protein [Mediterranea sp.]
MKKSIFYLMCATALLGLGACGEDIAAPGMDNPTLPTPDADGMVAVYLNASDGGYKDGAPEATRANGGEMVRFTHDLGDGFVMESELVPSPTTRVGEEPLADGVMVLVVAYDKSGTQANGGYPVLGYWLASVEDGKMLIRLNETETYNLALISENGTSASDLLKYVTGATATTTETFHELATTFTSQISLWYLTDGNKTGLAPDVLVSQLEGVTAASLSDPDVPTTIKFLHLFPVLTWELTAADPYGLLETIGDFSVGLYPRHGTTGDPGTWMQIGALSASTFDGSAIPNNIFMMGGSNAGTWSAASPAGTEPLPNILFERTDQVSGILTYTSDPTRFVFAPSSIGGGPSATPNPSGFYINSMEFITPAYGTLAISDKKLPIYTGTSGSESLAFRLGYSYTIKSKLSKRPIEFAASNIYWDGGKLTFDEEETSGSTNWAKQGVFFKWGSLVGISPAQVNGSDAWSGDVTVYVPQYNSGTGSSWYDGPSSGAPYNLTGAWEDIPYFTPPATTTDLNDASYNTTDMYNAYTGDICQYLGLIGAAPSGYRMPTHQDFAELGRPWRLVGSDSSTDTSIGVADGTANLASKAYLANSTRSLPASGQRYGNAAFLGTIQSVGTYTSSRYWESKAATLTQANIMRINKLTDTPPISGNVIEVAYALPIRCVKTLTE